MNPEEASQPTQLAALNFTRDIERLTAGFTGREWVFAAVDRWLADPDGARFFILAGEPGAGKSAIAARLAQRQPHVVAHHFCIAGRNATITPGAALRSLAAQLGKNLPGYGEALAERGEIAAALSTAELIEIGAIQAQAWAAVIETWMKAGARDQVSALLARALLAAERPGHGPGFVLMLAAWAHALAQAQRHEQALIIARHAWTAAEEVDDRELKSYALSDVAVALAESGALDQALDLIRTLSDDDHPSALLRMIPALASAGQLPRAAGEAARITYPGWRMEVQHAIEQQQAGPALPPPARPLEADEAALAMWRERFGQAFRLGRDKVFDTLREGASLLVAIDHGQTLRAIYEAVCEVDAWW